LHGLADLGSNGIRRTDGLDRFGCCVHRHLAQRLSGLAKIRNDALVLVMVDRRQLLVRVRCDMSTPVK
jgi:hypothetical protein